MEPLRAVKKWQETREVKRNQHFSKKIEWKVMKMKYFNNNKINNSSQKEVDLSD